MIQVRETIISIFKKVDITFSTIVIFQIMCQNYANKSCKVPCKVQVHSRGFRIISFYEAVWKAAPILREV